MKASHIAIIAIIVVAIAAVGVYFAFFNNGNPETDKLVGEWTYVDGATGLYLDGEPVYSELDDLSIGKIAISKHREKADFYTITTASETYMAAVSEDNTLVACETGDDATYTIITYFEKGDYLVMNSISLDEKYVISYELTRDGKPVKDSSKPGDYWVPSEGDSYESFYVDIVMDDGEISEDEPRTITFGPVHENILFYDVYLPILPSLDLKYVAIRISGSDWLAVADVEGRAELDIVNFDNGNTYTSNSIVIGDDLVLFDVCYGDKSKFVPYETKFEGRAFCGNEHALTLDDGVVALETDLPAELLFTVQDDNLVKAITYTDDKNEAKWNIIAYDHKDGSRLYIESIAEFNGVEYRGLYIGVYNEITDSINITGVAWSYGDLTVIFQQKYDAAVAITVDVENDKLSCHPTIEDALEATGPGDLIVLLEDTVISSNVDRNFDLATEEVSLTFQPGVEFDGSVMAVIAFEMKDGPYIPGNVSQAVFEDLTVGSTGLTFTGPCISMTGSIASGALTDCTFEFSIDDLVIEKGTFSVDEDCELDITGDVTGDGCLYNDGIIILDGGSYTVAVDGDGIIIGDIPETVFVGEWVATTSYTGYFEGSFMTYEEITIDDTMTIESVDNDGFYKVSFMDEEATFVAADNVLVGVDFLGNSYAYITVMGDHMVLSYVGEDDILSANVITLERAGTDPAEIPEGLFEFPIPEGESMVAYKVTKYGKDVQEDHTAARNTLTNLGNYDPLIFLQETYTEDGVSHTMYIVCMRVLPGNYIGVTYIEGDYALEMIQVDNGNIYCDTVEYNNGQRFLWVTCYGSEDAEQIVYPYMGDMSASGLQISYIFNDDSSRKEVVGVDMEVIEQIGNMIVVRTATDDQTAIWNGLMYKVVGDYWMVFEASAELDGEQFDGLYISLLSKDLKYFTVFGALEGNQGSTAVFVQSYVIY